MNIGHLHIMKEKDLIRIKHEWKDLRIQGKASRIDFIVRTGRDVMFHTSFGGDLQPHGRLQGLGLVYAGFFVRGFFPLIDSIIRGRTRCSIFQSLPDLAFHQR
jgi:hypothetical protein